MKALKPIMFVGTASDVGKSIISTGFCRIFKEDGYSPAPFKAQNMSLNSYATADGLEIGRAQAVQAEAAGIPCTTDMNPVLLKPTNDKSSQVILNGKPVGNQSAYTYFMTNDKKELFNAVKSAYQRLSEQYNPIVMEGAGSISELNLKHRDITNMRMAMHASASVFLVADIDRGGVFGSVYGTVALLSPEEKQLIKGIIINKFRGDVRLFEDGRLKLEALTGIPVVGVLPFLKELYIEEEDTVALANKNNNPQTGKVNVAVILLKRIANFTDFNALEKDERVHLFYTDKATDIAQADIIIIPGSKNTIADLIEIKNNGVSTAIIKAFKNNKTVIGICGGYQMMGTQIGDPLHIEGDIELMPALGLLPVETILTVEKKTQQCQFQFKTSPAICKGYEIHMGISTTITGQESNYLNKFTSGETEGLILTDKCWGTYIHGILDNEVVINDLLLPYTNQLNTAPLDYTAFKEENYNLLAQHLRKHIDINYIYKQLQAE